MKEKLIKILFATETLCIGVNVPVKTCVLTDIQKYTNDGKRYITTSEYMQMAGRAGRRGFDTHGNVIYLPIYEFPDQPTFVNIVKGKIENLQSSYDLDFKTILRIAQMDYNFMDLYNRTLMNFENKGDRDLLDKKINDETNEIINLENDVNKYNEFEKDLINTLCNFDNKIANKIILSKIQMTEYKTIKAQVLCDETSNKLYKLMQTILKKKQLLNTLTQTKKDNDIMNYYSYYKNILIELDYVVASELLFIDKSNITQKGVICSLINDCNEIILTEMIINNCLDGLTPPEIVSIISIFCEKSKNEIDVCCNWNGKIKKCIENIERYNLKFEQIENKCWSSNQSKMHFEICVDYIDAVYNWSYGKSINEIDNIVSVEIFCKVITKISNILISMINIHKTLGINIEIIPKLEIANAGILRDIVCVTSLYLC